MIIGTLKWITFVTSVLLATSSIGQTQEDRQKPCLSYANAIAQAKDARLKKNPNPAINIIDPLLKQSPDCFNLNFSYGLSFAEKGDFKTAVVYLKKARELRERDNVDENTIYNSLGWAYLLNGEYLLAEESFAKAMSNEIWAKYSNDSRRRVLNNSGLLFIYMGRYEDAEKNLKRADKEFDSTLARENLKRLADVRVRAAARNTK